MAKDKGDGGEGTTESSKRGSKQLSIATVAKPCLVGAALLTLVHAALGR